MPDPTLTPPVPNHDCDCRFSLTIVEDPRPICGHCGGRVEDDELVIARLLGEAIVRTVFADGRRDLVERVPIDQAESWAVATREDCPHATVTVEV